MNNDVTLLSGITISVNGRVKKAFTANEHNEYFGGIRGLAFQADNLSSTTFSRCADLCNARAVFSILLENLFMKADAEKRRFLDHQRVCDNCAFGWTILWSNSFLWCFAQQKDDSIWVIVVRISPPKEKSTSKAHTYCLAMRRSSD